MTKGERLTFLRDVQVIFQDPFEVYNPFYRVDHVLTMPIEYIKLAATTEEKWRADRAKRSKRSDSARRKRSAGIPINSAAASDSAS